MRHHIWATAFLYFEKFSRFCPADTKRAAMQCTAAKFLEATKILFFLMIQNQFRKILERIALPSFRSIHLIEKTVGHFLQAQIFTNARRASFFMFGRMQRAIQIFAGAKRAQIRHETLFFTTKIHPHAFFISQPTRGESCHPPLLHCRPFPAFPLIRPPQ